jgi:hypothetical protein
MENEQKPCEACGEPTISQTGSISGSFQMAHNEQVVVVGMTWYKCRNGHSRYFKDGQIVRVN